MNDTNRLIITIQPGEIYRWKSGLCLKALQNSSFVIPGALFRKGESLGSVLELSDDETEIVMLEEESRHRYPDMAVILKPGTSMRLNRNCEVWHIHIRGEIKQPKNFVIVEDP